MEKHANGALTLKATNVSKQAAVYGDLCVLKSRKHGSRVNMRLYRGHVLPGEHVGLVVDNVVPVRAVGRVQIYGPALERPTQED